MIMHDGVATVHVANAVAALVADADVDGHLAVFGINIGLWRQPG